ncbi:MAG: LysR substrate-binding domain-containing protein [Pseudomonadota bacterium]
MDIKQLKTFICVAETGSLSAASDRLRLAQPALSRHIKLLEHKIGVQLFERHVRGMTLTEPGEKLLARVSGLIRQLEQSFDDIRSVDETIKGNVAIGLMPSVNTMFAVRLIERVKRELPDITLRVVEGYSGHLIEWLQRGDLDVSFLYGPAADLHLRCKELLYEDIALISPPNTLPNLGEQIGIADMAHLPLVLPSRPHGIRMLVDNAAAKAGVSLNTALRGDAFEILKSLVVGGSYHAFIPLSAVSEELKAGSLEARTLVSPSIRRQLILAMPSDRPNTRATDAVVEILCREIAAMIDEGVWRADPEANLVETT